jgi:hypothetical protein
MAADEGRQERVWLAAALGQLGRVEAAQQAMQMAAGLSPQSFEFYVRNRPAWHRPENYEHMLEGLRKAGWWGLPAPNLRLPPNLSGNSAPLFLGLFTACWPARPSAHPRQSDGVARQCRRPPHPTK